MCPAVKMFGPANNADVREMARSSETFLTLADSKRNRRQLPSKKYLRDTDGIVNGKQKRSGFCQPAE